MPDLGDALFGSVKHSRTRSGMRQWEMDLPVYDVAQRSLAEHGIGKSTARYESQETPAPASSTSASAPTGDCGCSESHRSRHHHHRGMWDGWHMGLGWPMMLIIILGIILISYLFVRVSNLTFELKHLLKSGKTATT